jgi:hypothetical protein
MIGADAKLKGVATVHKINPLLQVVTQLVPLPPPLPPQMGVTVGQLELANGGDKVAHGCPPVGGTKKSPLKRHVSMRATVGR